MIIKSITLTNFRNHTNYHLDCSDETTLILGANGWGKTSVLEAIHILTRGKSFRASDQDIVKHGKSFYRITLKYDNGEEIVATYDKQKNIKSFITVDKKTTRLPKKYKYPVILFLPSDLNLISHSPSRRRDYFDRVLSELNDSYSANLSRYNKALRQRGELLKTGSSPESLFSWNLLLAEYGTKIFTQRKKIIQEFNSQLTDTYHSIAENQDQIKINHKTEVRSSSPEIYLKTLEQNYQKDSLLGHTSFGAHRDDYVFEFNHTVANGSASRGETRSIILALKFIEAKKLQEETGHRPIILLDDVFSELDEVRRHSLIKNFKDHQVIITSVEKID